MNATRKGLRPWLARNEHPLQILFLALFIIVLFLWIGSRELGWGYGRWVLLLYVVYRALQLFFFPRHRRDQPRPVLVFLMGIVLLFNLLGYGNQFLLLYLIFGFDQWYFFRNRDRERKV